MNQPNRAKRVLLATEADRVDPVVASWQDSRSGNTNNIQAFSSAFVKSSHVIIKMPIRAVLDLLFVGSDVISARHGQLKNYAENVCHGAPLQHGAVMLKDLSPGNQSRTEQRRPPQRVELAQGRYNCAKPIASPGDLLAQAPDSRASAIRRCKLVAGGAPDVTHSAAAATNPRGSARLHRRRRKSQLECTHRLLPHTF